MYKIIRSCINDFEDPEYTTKWEQILEQYSTQGYKLENLTYFENPIGNKSRDMTMIFIFKKQDVNKISFNNYSQ